MGRQIDREIRVGGKHHGGGQRIGQVNKSLPEHRLTIGHLQIIVEEANRVLSAGAYEVRRLQIKLNGFHERLACGSQIIRVGDHQDIGMRRKHAFNRRRSLAERGGQLRQQEIQVPGANGVARVLGKPEHRSRQQNIPVIYLDALTRRFCGTEH